MGEWRKRGGESEGMEDIGQWRERERRDREGLQSNNEYVLLMSLGSAQWSSS